MNSFPEQTPIVEPEENGENARKPDITPPKPPARKNAKLKSTISPTRLQNVSHYPKYYKCPKP